MPRPFHPARSTLCAARRVLALLRGGARRAADRAAAVRLRAALAGTLTRAPTDLLADAVALAETADPRPGTSWPDLDRCRLALLARK